MVLQAHWKHFRFSIRSAIVAVVLISTLMTASVAIGLHYHFSKALTLEAALSTYQQTATGTRDYLAAVDDKATETVRILSKFPKLIEDDTISEQSRDFFAEILQRNPIFADITVGFAEGGFYQLVNLNANIEIRQQLNVSAQDHWLVITVKTKDGKRYHHFDYFDEEFNHQRSWQEPTNYDVRKRPWFINAKAKLVHKTEPYLFQNLQLPGQTYSTQIEASNTVLAIGIVLPSISDFLQAQSLNEKSELYLYQRNGEIIASNIQQEKALVLPPAPTLYLSDTQKNTIKNNPYLTVSNETNWPPINFAIAGQPRGYSIDVLDYIAKMTGFQFRYVNGLDWQEMTQLFMNNELDIIQPVFFNSARKTVGELSQAFVDVPYGIISPVGNPAIKNVEQLTGKTVAIPKNWSLIDRVQKHFPQIKIVEVDSVKAMFTAVQDGEVDAGIDTAEILNYSAKEFFIEDVDVYQPFDFSPQQFPTELHFLVNNSTPEVAGIINLALERLNDTHKNALKNKWFNHEESVNGLMSTVPYADLIALTELGQSERLQTLSLNGEQYFVYAEPITEKDFLAIITPVDTVMAVGLDKVKTSILITAAIVLLLLPFIGLIASPLVRAIRMLVEDSERIKQRKYLELERVESNITEINDLANSMISMSDSIAQHEISQQELIEAFIELIAQAIDDKSPYTAGHCARVPELAFMLAEVANESEAGPFGSFKFKNENEWREFRIGAWLHDCGKITTPEHIIDKGTKLESIYNRIHEIRMRFEVLWRDAEIDYLQQTIEQGDDKTLRAKLEQYQQQLQDDFAFIAKCNIGGEYIDDDDIRRLQSLANTTWQRHFDDRLGLSPIDEDRFTDLSPSLPVTEQLLSDKPEHIIERLHSTDYDPKLGIKMEVPEHLYNLGELYNLTVSRGTLTAEDRFKINEHMISTIKMLENLPFPPELSQVARYATTHHETMKGTGYPRKLSAIDLSTPERIMVVADIFEALTAADRPYKKAKPISQAVSILHKMALRESIDIDVFELFLTSGVYLQYAKRFLPVEQIDDVNIEQYLR